MSLGLRSARFLVALVLVSSADLVRADDAWREHLAYEAPEWLPIVGAGYRLQLVREPLDEGPQIEVGHGFTVDALFPLLASGRHASRTRLAFALGVGADFAVARFSARSSADDSELHLRDRSTWLHAQVGVVLRTRVASRTAFVSTMAWQPGVRLLDVEGNRVTWGDGGFTVFWRGVRVGDDVYASLLRGRWTIALHHRGFRVALYLGASHRNDQLSWRRGLELDLGTQIGVGW